MSKKLFSLIQVSISARILQLYRNCLVRHIIKGNPVANEEDAKVTMVQCSGLHAAEEEKVERLKELITQRMSSFGVEFRFCSGRVNESDRVLEFFGNGGLATVKATDFLAAKDAESIALIKLSEAAQ